MSTWRQVQKIITACLCTAVVIVVFWAILYTVFGEIRDSAKHNAYMMGVVDRENGCVPFNVYTDPAQRRAYYEGYESTKPYKVKP